MSRSHVASTCSPFRFLGSESLDVHALILGPWKSSRPLSSVLLSICLGVGTIILALNKRVAKDIRRSNAPKAPIDLETKREKETLHSTTLQIYYAPIAHLGNDFFLLLVLAFLWPSVAMTRNYRISPIPGIF